jgi:hypothetical protein
MTGDCIVALFLSLDHARPACPGLEFDPVINHGGKGECPIIREAPVALCELVMCRRKNCCMVYFNNVAEQTHSVRNTDFVVAPNRTRPALYPRQFGPLLQ